MNCKKKRFSNSVCFLPIFHQPNRGKEKRKHKKKGYMNTSHKLEGEKNKRSPNWKFQGGRKQKISKQVKEKKLLLSHRKPTASPDSPRRKIARSRSRSRTRRWRCISCSVLLSAIERLVGMCAYKQMRCIILLI